MDVKKIKKIKFKKNKKSIDNVFYSDIIDIVN